MPLPTPTNVEIDAPDLATLLEAVLAHMYGDEPDAGDGVWLVGFTATAAEPRALLAAAIAEVPAIAAEEEAGVVSCSVSGVMATDEGWRAWGFVTVGVGTTMRRVPPRVAVERHGGGWRAVLGGRGPA